MSTSRHTQAVIHKQGAGSRSAGGIKPAVIRLIARVVTGTHVFLYRQSGGRIGGHLRGGPVLLLTVTGRKTGRERTTPLLYLEDRGDLVVAASNGGMDWAPSWWLNLRANPVADVQVGGEHRRVRAEQAAPAERARLWPLMNQMWPGYDGYQRRTRRVIPVVKLHQVDPAGTAGTPVTSCDKAKEIATFK